MKIAGSTALVTGASRGIGRHFAEQLVARGAKVYATARDPQRVDVAGVERLSLDVLDPESVAAAVEAASDVSLLVNNAGVSQYQDLVTGDMDKIHLEMETNYYGTLRVIRAFAPVLAANGGGAILNVLSRLAWLSYPGSTSYSAAKAAAWSLTNGVRLELTGRTQVTGVLMSATDTEMMSGWDIPKNDPADVVRQALDGLEAGAAEVLADEDTAQTKAALSTTPGVIYGPVLPGPTTQGS
ncbi:SDR family oxidoreductase [Streptomyces shenzhenensis]|uniref:SDR family oxidoreductase n=1 Tax=Streptomyces shenzhenensis TaxID=943815 RepID=UPI0033DBEA15